MHVLIADDQVDVRSAIKLVVEQEFGVFHVSEVEDAEHLLAQVTARHPDVVMLDWELPGLAAHDHVLQLRAAHPDVRVVVLSSRPGARSVALDAGADAFISKMDSPDRLLNTLREIGALNGHGRNHG